jgi:hypothetical protein
VKKGGTYLLLSIPLTESLSRLWPRCERLVVKQARNPPLSLDSNTPAPIPVRICKENEFALITYGHQPQILRLFLSIGPIDSSRFKNYSRISQTVEAIHSRVSRTPLQRQSPRRRRCQVQGSLCSFKTSSPSTHLAHRLKALQKPRP